MLALSFRRTFMFVLVIDVDGGSQGLPLLNLSRFASERSRGEIALPSPEVLSLVMGWVLGVAFIFVDISSTSAQPTFGELLGERRVGGEIYCAVRGCGCVGD
jgi:hypothetical protein